MKITENFSFDEMIASTVAERLCIDNMPNDEQQKNLCFLATQLQEVRTKFGKPIVVTSGFRSPKLNKKVGGQPNSYHLQGLAADVRPMYTGDRISDVSNLACLYTLLSESVPRPVELILYKSFIHVAYENRVRNINEDLPFRNE